MKRKKNLWGLIYGSILTIFTVYVLLDTFVVTRVYTEIPSDGGPSASHGQDSEYTERKLPKESPSTNDTKNTDGQRPANREASSFKDDNIAITITEYQEYGTHIYVADVQLTSAEYLKTALAQDSYGKNITEKTSQTAENNHAILAINGDYYGARENGYVLRNGMLYRGTAAKGQEDLVIYRDGSMSIVTEADVSAQQLLSDGAVQILSFGPALLTDGFITVTEDQEVGRAQASNPRTAIGILDGLHYLFVVSDGRTHESEGLTLYELADFMQSLGASTAYNLDGGGSSTMVFNGDVINNPTTSGRHIKERSVSDIVYIGY